MSVSEFAHFGHGEVTGSVTSFIASRHRRSITAAFSSSGGAITLPDARTMPGTGPDIFYVFNEGVNDIDIENANGGLVGTVQTGQMGTIDLSDRSTKAGVWHISLIGTVVVDTPDTIVAHTIGDNPINSFTSISTAV